MSALATIRTWWADGHPLLPARWTHDEKYNLTWIAKAANAYHRWTRWVRWSWWSYVLGPRIPYRYTTPSSWPRTVWCRLTGHRGRIYFNHGGALEPNDGCRGCGEEL